jgi:serine O-acetyltransferase
VSAVTAGEVLVIYAIPIAVLATLWLATSAVAYLLARFSATSHLGIDIRRRVHAKQQTRSGRRLRLSYPYVALSLAGDNCFQATVLHRAASKLDRKGMRGLGRCMHGFSKFLTNVDISPRADIGPGLHLYHGLGTVIGKGSTIGTNALICQNVTVGGGAVLGDDVCLWAGAKVIGRLSVGDRAEVGANGVVVGDVPPDTIAVGVPATRLLPKGDGRSDAQLREVGDVASADR